MDDKFFIGVALGMIGGAVLVTNSVKARSIVKDGEQEIIKRVNKLGKQKKSSK